jgi:phosphate transport system protein
MRAPRRILRGGSVKKGGSVPAARGWKLGKDTMERHFEKDLEELKDKLLWMGTLAERAVHRAVHAVLDSEPKLAEAVLEEEDVINELQIEIDDRVVQLLALHQLMAVDLRLVLAVSRINNDLERIGDQAVNIAQSAQRILRHPRVKPYVDLPRMSELAEGMVRDSLTAVVQRDVELAQKILRTDDEVDRLRDQMFRELLTYMMGDSAVVFPAFELILVVKNLERIGDHATNIAEDVIYIVAGQDVRHPTVDRR